MAKPGDDGWIEVRGARTHNLQDVDVKLPRGQFVVISGVSGSGKSSLASIHFTQKGNEDTLKAYPHMLDNLLVK